ncbi:TRAP transporter large permease subunit [Chloroflexota bacterium]
MDWWLILVLILGLLLILFATGLPVAFAFLALNILGLFFLVGGEKALLLLATSAYTSIASFVLIAVPLFILMGEILFHSGVVSVILEAVDHWIGRLRARLCLVAVGAGTILSAMTGSTLGDVALLGATLLPEMDQRGYDKKLSTGSILASSTIAAIIPPSGLAVLLGSLGGISIAGLLIGGIIPGLLLALSYTAYIIGITWIRPQLAPIHIGPHISLLDKLRDLLRIAPFGIIIFLVLGTILLGIASPSEAAAMGAFGCFIVAAFHKRLNFAVVKKSLSATMDVFGMVFIILVGSIAFSQVLSITGATRALTELVAALPLPLIVMFIIMQLAVFIMGMFIDSLSIMMITLPIFMPVTEALHIDPIWFGIVYLINIVCGGKTPPFALMLFVIKGVAPDTSMGQIYRGVVPFILTDIMGMALIMAFPAIALWLPRLVL